MKMEEQVEIPVIEEKPYKRTYGRPQKYNSEQERKAAQNEISKSYQKKMTAKKNLYEDIMKTIINAIDTEKDLVILADILLSRGMVYDDYYEKIKLLHKKYKKDKYTYIPTTLAKVEEQSESDSEFD